MSGQASSDTDIREGEVAAQLPPAFDASVYFIGRIRTPFATRADCPRRGDPEGGPECRIEVDPRFADALTGLDRYDDIAVLYWMNEARRDLLLQNPKHDGRLAGTFALRSPVRPNPIALSIVRMLGIDGPVLRVRGLDCVDGTPLIDIKPEFTGGRKPCDQ
ncbi:tRNA (N6-threonylcarbamoyladenosine(37)-N6)-methyltransferase TrmO [Pararhizobium haloflavum]|uniref:tRNA (N6-threonylcarbamoyladenosine(37)-N6)-methyltransferase TrmO n=1 Tax=Pararhizobium haloflavum TaxID=2037914 RepID=UPI000C185574|nr:tRNA (N6-threonylcarbamoyladenosine(37)-N6)-methyltransferase TrmO [Pararhizobium haloflavum]